jgi:hypothetical protein
MQEKQIFLQPDAEITDVVDKIKETDKPIVVLVIPESATVLQSIVNLKLLKREVDKLDKRLAIVTDSKKGQKLAKQVGISVYQKAKADEIVQEEEKKEVASDNKRRFPLALKGSRKSKSEDKEVKKKKNRKTSTMSKWLKYTIVALVVVVLGAGGALAYQYLPKATVNIKIDSLEESKTVKIKGEKDSSLAAGEFRVKEVSANASKKQEFDATGSKEVGGKASGQITIYNYWSSEPQPLVETTRFVHNSTNKLFRTTQAVTVPGTRIVEGETVPGTATVNIQASEVGSDYNVGPGQFNIPGLPAAKRSKIYGQSDSGLSGGYKKQILVVSQEDYNSAKDSLLSEIDKELNGKLDQKLDGWQYFDKKQEKILQESASPDVDQEAGSFELSLKKQAKTYAYQQEGFVEAIKEKFEESLSGQKELLTDGLEENIKIKKSNLNFDQGKIELTVDVKGKTIPKLDQEIVIKNIRNKDKIEAERYLTGFSQIKDARIDLWPFWVKFVPSDSGRVKINLIYDQQ